MNASPPTEEDWRSEPWGLDMPYAYEQFFGKNKDEAYAVIARNALDRQEDISVMPSSCFDYYFPVYLRYILSDDSMNDSDAANCLIGLVRHRMKDILSLSSHHVSSTAKALKRISDNQDWFDAEEDIYGSFVSEVNEITLIEPRLKN